jgi:hypothetical protein
MRFLLGAAGAWEQCAPALPVPPRASRLKSVVRLERGLRHQPAPQLPR